MLLLVLDSTCTGLAIRSTTWADLVGWLGIDMVAKACLRPSWLAFSLMCARADARNVISRAWWVLPLSPWCH